MYDDIPWERFNLVEALQRGTELGYVWWWFEEGACLQVLPDEPVILYGGLAGSIEFTLLAAGGTRAQPVAGRP